MRSFHNLIEQPRLVDHFLDYPPDGFAAMSIAGSLPAFVSDFDLLTTMEEPLRRRIEALPLGPIRMLLRPRTCFIGTTVSEFALFPSDVAPDDLVHSVSSSVARQHPFTIIKDIPADATIVGPDAAAYSHRIVEACTAAGFVIVDGQALAYVPIDFDSVDEYIGRLSHARRKNIRRKLRSRQVLSVDQIETGDSRFTDEVFVSELYALYLNVYEQSEIHFDRLTASFFRAVLRDAAVGGIVFVYRLGADMIGWNLCLCSGGMLIDKYVGFAYPAAREFDLYTVSWFENLEYALKRRLTRFVAGWTDPEVKRQLGAQFTFTVHAVYVRSRFVRAVLKPFKGWFEADRRWHEAHVATAHS